MRDSFNYQGSPTSYRHSWYQEQVNLPPCAGRDDWVDGMALFSDHGDCDILTSFDGTFRCR